jgi:hypothetical protein
MMLANAGVPALWFGFFFLTAANLLLGLVEGVAIAGAYRVGFRRAVVAMIAANFASSWTGYGCVLLVPTVDLTIANVHVTLVVELPFVRWLLSPRVPAWSHAARVTLLVHAVTYPLLLLCAWRSSELSLLTQWHVVPVAQLARPGTHAVFHVATDGEEVRRRDLATGSEALVGTLPAEFLGGDLFLQARLDGGASLHVWAHREDSATVCSGLSALATPTPSPAGWNDIPSLTGDSAWHFRLTEYGTFVAEAPRQRRVLRLETPLAWWRVHAATHVADDLVLVSLADQICLVKASTAEIALVARGHGATIAAVRR